MSGITGYLLDRLGTCPERAILEGNRLCRRDSWTAADIISATEGLAAGLDDIGLRHGDRVGLISDNHDLWLIADLALLMLGAVDVPRAADVSLDEAGFVLGHSQCRGVVFQTQETFQRYRERLSALPIDIVVVLANEPGEGYLTADQLMERGRERLALDPTLQAKLRGAASGDDLATIVYTSGTTGNPKGVMLRHRNILHNVKLLPQLVDFTEKDCYLSFLPSWHTFERTLDYSLIGAHSRIMYSTRTTLRKDMISTRPTVLAGVPRLWESIAAGVVGKLDKAPLIVKKLLGHLEANSRRHADAKRRLRGHLMGGEFIVVEARGLARASAMLRAAVTWPAHALMHRLVYGKVRKALGGKVKFIVSGGGALPGHVDEFFNRAGICLLNGYGLTETSPVVCVRLPHRNVLATAGRRLAETEWKIVDEAGTEELPRGKKGVLWVRGPQVMSGYFENQDATDAVLKDGWFCTGDLAALTDRDDVVICGRVKDTIVLRGGENIEPEAIEAELAQSPLISDAILVGHTHKHLGALIIPDADAVRARRPALSKFDDRALAHQDECVALLHAEVQRLIAPKRGFRVFERVPKIVCLESALSVEDDTLTATFKKRRMVIESRYAREIDGMFGEKDGREGSAMA